MKNIIITITLVFIAIFGLYAFTHQQSTSKFGSVNNYPLAVNPTDTSVVCGPQSGLLLATSTLSRPLVYLSNTATSTMQVFLGMGKAASINNGLMIPANNVRQLDSQNVFFGAIYCIANASTTVSISSVN